MIHILTGNDRHAIKQYIGYLTKLITKTDPWLQRLNVHHYGMNQLEDAINTAITLPFGNGGKLVVVENCEFRQFGDRDWELLQILESLPKNHHLVFQALTIDKRLKVSKYLLSLIQEQRLENKWHKELRKLQAPNSISKTSGFVKEFNLIPPWRTDLIENYIATVAEKYSWKYPQLRLTKLAIKYLAEAIGNDTEAIASNLQKLYCATTYSEFTLKEIKQLVPNNNGTALELADALRRCQTKEIARLLDNLLSKAEHPLKILATLSTQFKNWLWVKAAIASGLNDNAEIAKTCAIGNPKRLYFLRDEVKNVSLEFLTHARTKLLDLEILVKNGSLQEDCLIGKLLEIV